MVAPLGSRCCVMPSVLLRKHPLPDPFPVGIRVHAGQGIGHQYASPSRRSIGLMQVAHFQQMLLQPRHQPLEEQRKTFLAPFAITHLGLPRLKVEILNPQAE